MTDSGLCFYATFEGKKTYEGLGDFSDDFFRQFAYYLRKSVIFALIRGMVFCTNMVVIFYLKQIPFISFCK